MELDCKGSELYSQEEGTFDYRLWIYSSIEDVVMTPKKGVIKCQEGLIRSSHEAS